MEAVTREVLNVDQAAEFLGFSAYTVREKARSGEIPGRKVGREWRFSREQLLEWLRAGKAPTTENEAVQEVMAALQTASYAKKYRLELPVDERQPTDEISKVSSPLATPRQ
jgi:excisionase family DNA binding protein